MPDVDPDPAGSAANRRVECSWSVMDHRSRPGWDVARGGSAPSFQRSYERSPELKKLMIVSNLLMIAGGAAEAAVGA